MIVGAQPPLRAMAVSWGGKEVRAILETRQKTVVRQAGRHKIPVLALTLSVIWVPTVHVKPVGECPGL